jgi:hypothetical protein
MTRLTIVAVLAVCFAMAGCEGDNGMSLNPFERDAGSASGKSATADGSSATGGSRDSASGQASADSSSGESSGMSSREDSTSSEDSSADASSSEGGQASSGPINKPEDLDLTGTEPYGWTDAKVGWSVTYQMPNDQKMYQEVLEVRDKALLMRTRMTSGGNQISDTQMWMARYVKKGDAEHQDTENPDVETKQLPDETVSIKGKSVDCEVWQSIMKVNGKKITSTSWTSKDVPGWIVRSKSDATGTMEVSMDLIDFTK